MLIYETDDSGFADSVTTELNRAGIDAYTTGGSLPGGSSPTVCVYIRNPADSHRANEILVQQGAVVDAPPRISSRLIVAGIVAAAVVTALIVVGVNR